MINQIGRFWIVALATLWLSGIETRQSEAEEKSTLESTHVHDRSGNVVGTLNLTKSVSSGQVEALSYSGPPDLVVAQQLDWTKWHEHRHLEEIDIALTTLETNFLRYVSKLNSVKTIRIEGCKLSEDALKPLSEMKGLREFDISMASGYPVKSWTFLEGMENLRVLSISGGTVTADFAKSFPHLKNLRFIRFSVDEESAKQIFPQLANLKSIQSINISRFNDNATDTEQMQ